MKTIIWLLFLLFSCNVIHADGIKIIIKKQEIPFDKKEKWIEQIEFDLIENNEVFSKEQLRIYIDWVFDQIKQGFVSGKMMIYDGWLLSWNSFSKPNELEQQQETVEIRIEDKLVDN
jgi:hypothetical protein